jgi:diacylglycerol kinase
MAPYNDTMGERGGRAMIDSAKHIVALIRSCIIKIKLFLMENKRRIVKMIGRFLLFVTTKILEASIESIIESIIKRFLDSIL